MKESDYKKELKEIQEIFCEITDMKVMKKLFSEIFTPGELDDFSSRWALLKLLKKGHTQRDIASRLSISLCKITRGSRILKDSKSVLNGILDDRLPVKK